MSTLGRTVDVGIWCLSLLILFPSSSTGLGRFLAIEFTVYEQDLGVVSAHLVAVGLPERTLGIDRLEKSKLCTIHGSIPPHVLIVFEVI